MIKKFLDMNKKINENGELKTFVEIDTEIIQSGVLSDLKPIEFSVLTVLASHMDEQGKCFPSMEYIAKLLGSTKPTVLKAVNGVLNFRYNDLPVVTRVIEGSGARKKSIYSFVINENIEYANITEEELKEMEFTAKTAVLLFAQEFEKEFGFAYKIIWKQDAANMKNMLELYGEEKLRMAIDIAVHDYKKRWGVRNTQFPTPTINAFTKFICQQALEIANKKNNNINNQSKWDNYDNDENLVL